MKTIIISLIVLILFLVAGCSEITKVSDPCKSAFENCNYNCGDGILSSVCKEKCTYQYNKCQEGKNEN